MVFFVIASIIFSLLSFKGGMYWWLLPRLGVGWAYVLDQGLPLAVATVALVLTLKQRFNVAAILKRHIAAIAALIVATVLAHGLVLRYFFFAEDVSTILYRVTNGDPTFAFHPLINGYPFAPFIASFLLFGTNAWLYNTVTIMLFVLSVLAMYGFSITLTGGKSIALLAALFYATTPVFLDVFSWQANAQGMPLVLGAGIISFWFIVFYKKKGISVYYLLSLLFFAAAIKMAFVRIAGILFPLLILLFLPMKKGGREFVGKVLESLPFIAVWYGFVTMRLTPEELAAFLKAPQGSVTPPFVTGDYIARLAYYSAHLVIPNGISAKIFPLLKNALFFLHADVLLREGVAVFVGEVALILCLFLAAVALFRLRSATSRMLLFSTAIILGTLFYVPFYIPASIDISRFDWNFARITPPYGPGSRYVFAASLGVGLLFALTIEWLLDKKHRMRLFGVGLTVIVLLGNVYLTIFHHRHIVRVISNPERAIIGGVLRMVPRDGKKKLVYSVNPKRNPIDSNTNNWRWLHGFYRETELYYTNSRDELDRLIASGAYEKDEIFAFYVNPQTHAFTDISAFLRQQLREAGKQSLAIPFDPDASQSQFQAARQIAGLFIAKRPVLTSPELSYRILGPSLLHLPLTVTPLSDILYPFSDTVFPSAGTGLPQQLWWMMRVNAPLVVQNERELESSLSLLSFNDRPLTDISLSDRLGIARILLEQEQIHKGLRVRVSNIFSDDPRSVPSSLTDGVFDADPAPTKDDVYYFARETSATITLQLAHPIVLGRVLLNTPKSMMTDHLPVAVTILASLRGSPAVAVGALTENMESNWSPNNGTLLVIPTKQILADSVSVVVSKTTGAPVIVDEVIIDPVQSLSFTPAQLLEVGERNFWYVGNETLFQTLLPLTRYRTLTFAYACAEDVDWAKQKRNIKAVVPGVWQLSSVPTPVSGGALDIDVPLDCHGSVLRQVTLIGPPFPARLRAGVAEIR